MAIKSLILCKTSFNFLPERTALVAEGDTEAGVAVSLIVVPEGVVVLLVIDLVVCSSVEDCE